MPYVRKETRDLVDMDLNQLIASVKRANLSKEKIRPLVSYILMKLTVLILTEEGKPMDVNNVFDMKAVLDQTYDEINQRFSVTMEEMIVTKDFFDPTHEQLK